MRVLNPKPILEIVCTPSERVTCVGGGNTHKNTHRKYPIDFETRITFMVLSY